MRPGSDKSRAEEGKVRESKKREGAGSRLFVITLSAGTLLGSGLLPGTVVLFQA